MTKKPVRFQNLYTGMEPAETDMFLRLTPLLTVRERPVFKIQMSRRVDEVKNTSRVDVKVDENYETYFGVTFENRSHTRRAAMKTKPANKQARITTENQKDN